MTEFATFCEASDGRVIYSVRGPNGTSRVEGDEDDFHAIRAQAFAEAGQVSWPRIEGAAVSADGQTLGVMVREFDGTISAVSIDVSQLAD